MHTLIAKLSALALLAAILLTAPASGRVPKAEIVFARFRGDSTGISAIRPGGQPRRLTRGSHWYPTWSPDRTKIAFVEFVNFEPSSLWVVDRDGGNERKLIDLFAGEYYRVGFDWSPDGSKLVYSDRIDGAGSFDLYVIDVETLETTKITSDESTDEEEPDWS